MAGKIPTDTVSTGIAEALGLVFFIEIGQRVVAVGDIDAAASGLVTSARALSINRGCHDHDAVGLGGKSPLLEMRSFDSIFLVCKA